jgi:hypothetical protein
MLGSLGFGVDDFFYFPFISLQKSKKKHFGIGSVLDFIK